MARDEEDVPVHLGRRESVGWGPQAENFAFARAICDAVCFPDTPHPAVLRLAGSVGDGGGRGGTTGLENNNLKVILQWLGLLLS